MRIASVEQLEPGTIFSAVNHGSGAQVGKAIEPLWRSVDTQSGWMEAEKNHSHLTVARHLREKTHPSMQVVTIREGEERGLCSAALRELLRVVRDQIEERGVAIIVSNKESTIWRKTSVKTLLREKQLKDTDVEEMRVITNDRHIAEQIKSDLPLSVQGNLLQQNLKSVVMDGPKVGEFGKVGKEQKWKSIAKNGVKSGKGEKVKNVVMDGVKTGKLGNCKIDEEMWSQSEERLC